MTRQRTNVHGMCSNPHTVRLFKKANAVADMVADDCAAKRKALGIKGNRSFWRVDDADYTWSQIRERVPASVSDNTLRSRLARHYANTWALLMETPAQALARARKEGGKTYAHKSFLRRQHAREKQAFYAAKKAGHKPL